MNAAYLRFEDLQTISKECLDFVQEIQGDLRQHEAGEITLTPEVVEEQSQFLQTYYDELRAMPQPTQLVAA